MPDANASRTPENGSGPVLTNPRPSTTKRPEGTRPAANRMSATEIHEVQARRGTGTDRLDPYATTGTSPPASGFDDGGPAIWTWDDEHDGAAPSPVRGNGLTKVNRTDLDASIRYAENKEREYERGQEALRQAPHEPDDGSLSWPTISGAAFYGLAGEIVRTLEPFTEADPVALLMDVLVSFGNAAGSGPYVRIGGDKHPGRLNIGLVGDSAKARKGTSRSLIRRLMEAADPEWSATRQLSGLSSGEGLVEQVMDPVTKWKKTTITDPDTKERAETLSPTLEHPGVADKRLFVTAGELAGHVMAVMRRPENPLSAVMRDAWDHGNLAIPTRRDPIKATGAHISVLGHATFEELGERMTEVDIANGWANRFLWVAVRRSKVLPDGGAGLTDTIIEDLGKKLRRALDLARPEPDIEGLDPADAYAAVIDAMHGAQFELRRTPEAEHLWDAEYRRMADDAPSGAFGQLIARDSTQVLRLSVVYALLDGALEIDVPHLRAALAVWAYCRATAEMVAKSASRGRMTGDPDMDAVYAALVNAGDPLNSRQLNEATGLNGARLAAARAKLIAKRMAENVPPKLGTYKGRPPILTVAR